MAVFLYEPSLKAVMVQVRELEDLREWDLPAWLREKSVPDALPEVYLALIPRHLTAILQPGDTHIFRQMKQKLGEIFGEAWGTDVERTKLTMSYCTANSVGAPHCAACAVGNLSGPLSGCMHIPYCQRPYPGL